MSDSDQHPSTTPQPNKPGAEALYSIESVARITQTSRHLIAVYCRHGLIAPIAPPEHEGWWFDDDAIRTLRHIELMRSEYGVNLHGVRMVVGLLAELESLRQGARFLRGQ